MADGNDPVAQWRSQRGFLSIFTTNFHHIWYYTNVNVGKRNFKMTRVLERSKSVYFMGCPCHIIHNCAGYSSEAFVEAVKCDLGDMAVDVYLFIKEKESAC